MKNQHRFSGIDHGTLWGALAAFGLLFFAILVDGGISSFIDLRSILIVLGGTLGATLITFPLKDFARTLAVIRPALFPEETSARHRLSKVMDLARRSRIDGELSLEEQLYYERDPFLHKCIALIVDAIPTDEIRRTLELDISFLEDRHRRGAEILQTMGTIAPAMGLIGTLIGLVRMLESINDPAGIGPAMAVALLTTFYGALLAHIVFLPLAGKLKTRSEEERLIKQMTLEGVIAIADGSNPRMIEQRLFSFLPPELRNSQYESNSP